MPRTAFYKFPNTHKLYGCPRFDSKGKRWAKKNQEFIKKHEEYYRDIETYNNERRLLEQKENELKEKIIRHGGHISESELRNGIDEIRRIAEQKGGDFEQEPYELNKPSIPTISNIITGIAKDISGNEYSKSIASDSGILSDGKREGEGLKDSGIGAIVGDDNNRIADDTSKIPITTPYSLKPNKKRIRLHKPTT